MSRSGMEMRRLEGLGEQIPLYSNPARELQAQDRQVLETG